MSKAVKLFFASIVFVGGWFLATYVMLLGGPNILCSVIWVVIGLVISWLSGSVAAVIWMSGYEVYVSLRQYLKGRKAGRGNR